MAGLADKKVLLFAPNFFGYELEISNKLKKMGAEVDYFDERPKNNFVTKASIRINKNLLRRKILSYYGTIFKKTERKRYDYVFVINIEAMLPSLLKTLKQQQSSAIFVLYMWDSLQNKKYTLDYLPFFDRIYSFDKTDADAIPGVNFRPLFYIDSYAEIKTNIPIKNALCFIGTVHSDRYQLISEIRKQLAQLSLNTYFFMFFSSPILFFYKKMVDIKFYNARFKEFSFRSFSQHKTIQCIGESFAVLDIQHPSQTGLTIRTIEALGANKKLITTNVHIKEYDFYNPHNICVVNRDRPVIPKSFFETQYCPPEHALKCKYSLEGWLTELFA
ncbi:lipopolysaccharide biosynthesis protein [Pedobacter ginsengisoli]|nr:lipopolysaccharide biosynthesis protein [Pedobacter ginsengisoli]